MDVMSRVAAGALSLRNAARVLGRELSPGEADLAAVSARAGPRALRASAVWGARRIGVGHRPSASGCWRSFETNTAATAPRALGPTLAAEHLAGEDGLDRRSRDVAPLDAGGRVCGVGVGTGRRIRQRRERKAHCGRAGAAGWELASRGWRRAGPRGCADDAGG